MENQLIQMSSSYESPNKDFLDAKQHAGIIFHFNYIFHRFYLIVCILILKHRMMSSFLSMKQGANVSLIEY